MPPKSVLAIGSVIWALFFAGIPITAAAIAYAAWKGIPKNFSREMYWTVFVSASAVGGLLTVLAQRISLSSFWEILAHYGCGISGLLLFPVGVGCGAAVFTYRGPTFSRSPRPGDE
jgi:hypothetical protein